MRFAHQFGLVYGVFWDLSGVESPRKTLEIFKKPLENPYSPTKKNPQEGKKRLDPTPFQGYTISPRRLMRHKLVTAWIPSKADLPRGVCHVWFPFSGVLFFLGLGTRFDFFFFLGGGLVSVGRFFLVFWGRGLGHQTKN